MAIRRRLHELLIMFCILDITLCVDIRFPRKNILSLETLKNAGNTWYEMYYAAPLLETELYYNVGWQFTWLSSDQLRLSYSGLYDGVCESGSFPQLSIIKPDKAAFLDGTGHYYVFFSTDPSQYLFLFECWSGAMPHSSRVCPPDQTYVTFMVKNQRPDSLSFMSAINDLKRNTNQALAFDSLITTGGNPLKFFYTMVGEHISNASSEPNINSCPSLGTVHALFAVEDLMTITNLGVKSIVAL